MQSTMYHSKDFLLIRKPHGIPSTFGEMESFLDILKETVSKHIVTWTPLSSLVPAELFPLCVSHTKGFQEVSLAQECEAILRQQVDTFGQDQEYGLLNRLDNETSGFLYFARSLEAFAHFKSLQKSKLVKKIYLAQIEGMWKRGNVEMLKCGNVEKGNPSTLQPFNPSASSFKPQASSLKLQASSLQPQTFNINLPIMHSKSDPTQMIAICKPQDIRKGRSRQHHVSTQVDILHYEEKTNLTTIFVTITRGIRHQIRVHLASQGIPIVGDILYGKGGGLLHLWSIGFQMP